MVEFKVPEFVNYGQRVTLQVNMVKLLNVNDMNNLGNFLQVSFKSIEIYTNILHNVYLNAISTQIFKNIFPIWTNIFDNLDKLIFEIWTNIFCNFDKCILQFGQI